MKVSSRRIWARRAGALALALTASAAVWLLVVRPGGEPTAGDGPAVPVPQRSAELARSLSDVELVDQALLVGFEGTDASAPIVGVLRERELGGVIVDRRNWLDAASGTVLLAELRAAGRGEGRIPPLIVADQEGGAYRSYADLPPDERQLDLGDGGSVDAVEDWALQTAKALREAGFDLNLFPVADVATLDSPVADRAFSDDPGLVAEMTLAALRGCERARLACAPLHFPGLGAASGDPSQGPATVSLDAASLEARDLVPFVAAARESPALVLSLAFYAAYDAVTPGALAPAVVTGLLREELGFRGVAISDDLSSGAGRAALGPREAAVRALAAGTDLVQVGDPVEAAAARAGLLAALRSGELERERLEEAAARVLELKRELFGVLPEP